MITPVSRAVAVNPDPAIKLKAGIGLFTNAVAGTRNLHAKIAERASECLELLDA
jgi:hypothetical protein